jgi:catechol 2,3-dioxygenase-like lactoylglutathione lyase family enzyme
LASSDGAGGRAPVRRLGHVGLYVRDLEKTRDFYRDMLGLTVTDEDLGRGFVFLSARPDEEHHELALIGGRETDDSVQMVQQVSWQVDSVEELQAFHHLFKQRGVPIHQEVTHGNALGIYFYDPEGNRGEVYYPIKEPVRQPFRKAIDMELPPDQLLAENKRLVEESGLAAQPAPSRPG